MCAFCYNDVAAEPNIFDIGDAAIRIGAVPLLIDKPMLVRVHNSAAPRCEYVFAECYFFMADNQWLGTEIEIVA